MSKWSRREFLALSASVGVSACAGAAGWNEGRKFQAAIAVWNERSRLVAEAFHATQSVRVTAVAGVGSRPLSRREELLAGFTGSHPTIYPDVASMLRHHTIDLLYASGSAPELADWSGHLLIDGPSDPRAYAARRGRCVQILPQYEFAGCGRSAATLSGDWTRASIDCRGSLPDAPIESCDELAQWLYGEVGEAIDFTSEMMGMNGADQIFAAAAPAASPYQARLGWRMVKTGTHSKSIEVSVYAVQFNGMPKGIQIRLSADRQSLILRAAPRSIRLTHLLTANMIEAMTNSTPGSLIYSPRELSAAHELVQRAAAILVA